MCVSNQSVCVIITWMKLQYCTGHNKQAALEAFLLLDMLIVSSSALLPKMRSSFKSLFKNVQCFKNIWQRWFPGLSKTEI